MRQILTPLIVIIATVAGGAGVLYALGSLSEWRRIADDLVIGSLWKYLVIIAVTVNVYQFARFLVTVGPTSALDKSQWWREWAYLRWVLISVFVGWGFAAMTTEGAAQRAGIFLQGYVALLIVGLFGTYVGVKAAGLKRELKQ